MAGNVTKPPAGITTDTRIKRTGSKDANERFGKVASDARRSANTAPVQPTVSLRQHPRQTTTSAPSIGEQLGQQRRDAGLTQIKLAFEMKTTQPALARLEKGQSSPNLTTVSRYADALNKDVLVQIGSSTDGTVESNDTLLSLDNLVIELAQRRRDQGITQSKIANLMEATQPMIARLERNASSPNLRTIERYAAAIGTTIQLVFKARADN